MGAFGLKKSLISSKSSNSARGQKRLENMSGRYLITFSISTPPKTQFKLFYIQVKIIILLKNRNDFFVLSKSSILATGLKMALVASGCSPISFLSLRNHKHRFVCRISRTDRPGCFDFNISYLSLGNRGHLWSKFGFPAETIYYSSLWQMLYFKIRVCRLSGFTERHQDMARY